MENVSALALVVRVVVSLGVVLAIMAGAAAVLRRNGVPGRKSGLGRRSAPARVEVLARHGLSRTSSVAVVKVGDRALVLGVTEQQITLLSEADPSELIELQDPGVAGTPLPAGGIPPISSAWKAVVETMRDRTVRRS